MTTIIFVDHDGTEHPVQAEHGNSLMETAVRNGVSSIEGECGGALACATCHIYVPADWRGVTGEPSDDEKEMLECGIDVDDRSRLSCQIVVTQEMDGMTVLMPASQR